MAEGIEAIAASKTAETVPAVPSSTSEVSVRTMVSDLTMMGKGGGMVPPAEVSRVAVTPEVAEPTGPLGVPPPRHTAEGQESSWVRPLIWTTVAVVGAGVLFGLGFYVIPMFLKR